jgi:hypothetical protein
MLEEKWGRDFPTISSSFNAARSANSPKTITTP